MQNTDEKPRVPSLGGWGVAAPDLVASSTPLMWSMNLEQLLNQPGAGHTVQ